MSDNESRPGSGSGVPAVDGDRSRLERFELLAARERAEYETAERLYLDSLVRADATARSPAVCADCGAGIEWVGEQGWQVRGVSQPCSESPSGDHHVGDDEEHLSGPHLAERVESMGADVTECPECGMASVLHVPDLYPVCQRCEWTGWERDEVDAVESAQPR